MGDWIIQATVEPAKGRSLLKMVTLPVELAVEDWTADDDEKKYFTEEWQITDMVLACAFFDTEGRAYPLEICCGKFPDNLRLTIHFSDIMSQLRKIVEPWEEELKTRTKAILTPWMNYFGIEPNAEVNKLTEEAINYVVDVAKDAGTGGYLSTSEISQCVKEWVSKKLAIADSGICERKRCADCSAWNPETKYCYISNSWWKENDSCSRFEKKGENE